MTLNPSLFKDPHKDQISLPINGSDRAGQINAPDILASDAFDFNQEAMKLGSFRCGAGAWMEVFAQNADICCVLGPDSTGSASSEAHRNLKKPLAVTEVTGSCSNTKRVRAAFQPAVTSHDG